MRRSRRTGVLACLAAVNVVCGLWAEPPRVLRTAPEAGASDVDPALQELRVVFDQPMSHGGWSIVGGGPNFPNLIGKGRWEDARTLVWAWQLEPDHEYWLSINSARFTNFRNTNGEPAEPYPLPFHTARSAGNQSGAKEPAQAPLRSNREAARQLQLAIDLDYSYRDLRRVDWSERFAQFQPQLESAGTARAFAQAAAQLLAPAKDIHLWLAVGEERIPTCRRVSDWNVRTSKLPQLIPQWRRLSPVLYSGVFEDGLRYLCIRSWPSDAAEIEPAYELLAEAARAGRGLILDVRANGGGSEPTAQLLAGCFVDQSVAYAKHAVRNQGEWSHASSRVLEPNARHPHYRGKTAVLIGLGTVSSSESFAMMMKQVSGCTLLGEHTAGCSGNPQPVSLGNGVVVYVPSWRDLRLDESCLEGEGFAPDVAVKADPGAFEEGDPVLEEALRLLRTK